MSKLRRPLTLPVHCYSHRELGVWSLSPSIDRANIAVSVRIRSEKRTSDEDRRKVWIESYTIAVTTELGKIGVAQELIY